MKAAAADSKAGTKTFCSWWRVLAWGHWGESAKPHESRKRIAEFLSWRHFSIPNVGLDLDIQIHTATFTAALLANNVFSLSTEPLSASHAFAKGLCWAHADNRPGWWTQLPEHLRCCPPWLPLHQRCGMLGTLVAFIPRWWRPKTSQRLWKELMWLVPRRAYPWNSLQSSDLRAGGQHGTIAMIRRLVTGMQGGLSGDEHFCSGGTLASIWPLICEKSRGGQDAVHRGGADNQHK